VRKITILDMINILYDIHAKHGDLEVAVWDKLEEPDGFPHYISPAIEYSRDKDGNLVVIITDMDEDYG
jgi:hypothetical protein